MTIKKYGERESFEVFKGLEAEVVNQHLRKTGKAVSEFDEGELAALNADLETVRPTEEATQASPTKEPRVKSSDKPAKTPAKDGQNTQEASGE